MKKTISVLYTGADGALEIERCQRGAGPLETHLIKIAAPVRGLSSLKLTPRDTAELEMAAREMCAAADLDKVLSDYERYASGITLEDKHQKTDFAADAESVCQYVKTIRDIVRRGESDNIDYRPAVLAGMRLEYNAMRMRIRLEKLAGPEARRKKSASADAAVRIHAKRMKQEWQKKAKTIKIATTDTLLHLKQNGMKLAKRKIRKIFREEKTFPTLAHRGGPQRRT